MRRERFMRRTIGLAGVFVGLAICAGCREQPAPPGPFDRNLGDKEGELMPVVVAPADARVLQDQSTITEPTFSAAKRAQPAEPGAEEGAGRGGRTGFAPEGAPAVKKPSAELAGLAGLMEKAEKEKNAAAAKTDTGAPPKPKAETPKSATPTATAPAGAAKSATPGASKPAEAKPADKKKTDTKPAPGPAVAAAKPALPAEKPEPAAAATPKAAASRPISLGSAGQTANRLIDSLTLSLSAPWQPWKPPTGESLIAAFTQKGIGDAGAWGFALPREIKPEMANSEIGRFALSAKLKDEASRRFSSIDKWSPGSQTVVLDGVQLVEARCTLKKGDIAGGQDTGQAICYGIVGKSKCFLVALRVPSANKDLEGVRKAVLAGIKMK